MSSPSRLLSLAEEARVAVHQAVAAKAGDQEQKEFARLAETLDSHRVALSQADFVLTTTALCPTPDEMTLMQQSLGTLRAAVGHARKQLATAPAELRRSRAWKALDEAAQTARRAVAEVRTATTERLIDGQPKPRVALLHALPPGSELREQYRALSERYEDRVQRLETAADVSDLLAVGARLCDLETEVQARAVPAEHRELWDKLLSGRTTYPEITPEFAAWLTEAGHMGNLIVRYGAQ